MRAHYLQHVPFEGPGSIEPTLRALGCEITSTRLFESHTFPRIADIDLLIIMGGPMSANDERAFPWLAAEKSWIRSFIESGKPVLGICLGSQLIASALGSKIRRNPQPEIGWFPIHSTPATDPDLFRFPANLDVFHWHGETFDLPPGATRLARSTACENQAFQIGNSVIGLQFHLETTPESARCLIKHCADDLQPSDFVQSAESLLAVPPTRHASLNAEMRALLNWLIQTHLHPNG